MAKKASASKGASDHKLQAAIQDTGAGVKRAAFGLGTWVREKAQTAKGKIAKPRKAAAKKKAAKRVPAKRAGTGSAAAKKKPSRNGSKKR